MGVTIFGTDYIGLVTGTCLAEVGHVDYEVMVALLRDVVDVRL